MSIGELLSSEEATALLAGIDVSTVVGLHVRPIIGDDLHLRPEGAVVALNLEDYYPQKKRWWPRLREKNGKGNQVPCHHKLETHLDAHIEAAGIKGDHKGPLFRAVIAKTKKLRPGAISRCMVHGAPPCRRRGHRNRDRLPLRTT